MIKLNRLAIGGRLYNWVPDFLFGRTVGVRVCSDYSK